jgi:hypothetical protein
MHSHQGLGYLVFLVGLVNVVLVVAGGRSEPRTATLLHWTHLLGFMMAGRIAVVLGLALWAALPGFGVATWWTWAGLLLWAPCEVANKRFMRPEIAAVREGGVGSSRMVVGVVIELVAVIATFGIMSAHG